MPPEIQTHLPFVARAKNTIPVHTLSPKQWKRWLGKQPKTWKNWVKASGFEGTPGTHCLIPNSNGELAAVVSVVADPIADLAQLQQALPKGKYKLLSPEPDANGQRLNSQTLGWALGAYRFDRYRSFTQPKRPSSSQQLLWPAGADAAETTRIYQGIALGRDLITTPAEDMGPADLQSVTEALAKLHGAKCTVIQGKKLESEFPSIHAVGRASHRAPRLIELRWAPKKGTEPETTPKITLVGKGVCFDSGGLDLKPPAAMKLMKKDMGGAATVLGLAHALMDSGIPIQLRVLIPAVDNCISETAFRPLDVLQTRRGMTVEIGNTDAEGRLILSDALTWAGEENPELIVDMATLTGAARVALGADLPALFSTDPTWASALLESGNTHQDPLWQMPLHQKYRTGLDSTVADINNIASGSYGGAITAALFLREFVPKNTPWVHIDTMAYNNGSRPDCPVGGETLGLRALYHALQKRYGKMTTTNH